MACKLIRVFDMVHSITMLLNEMSYLEDEINEFIESSTDDELAKFTDPKNLQVHKYIIDYFTVDPAEILDSPLAVLDDAPISFVYGFYQRFQHALKYFLLWPLHYKVALVLPNGKETQHLLLVAAITPTNLDCEDYPIIFPEPSAEDHKDN
jgi:hypothetical protein